MKNLFLSEPCKKFQKSFEKYVMAYKHINDDDYYGLYKMGMDNFDEYLALLRNNSKGIDLEEGWVATSSFWLVDADINEVVGVVRVRHEEVGTAGHIGYDISPLYRNKGYGNEILKLALENAVKLGILEAVVSCNVNNIASKRIIEKNNGQLIGTVYDEEEDESLFRFKIPLTDKY